MSSNIIQKSWEKATQLYSQALPIIEKLSIQLVVYLRDKSPLIQSFIFQLIEFAFGPRQILNHLLFIVGLQYVTMTIEGIRSFTAYVSSLLTAKGRKELGLLNSLSKAASYEEWKRIASELDRLRGYDEWQMIDVSSLYDYRVLKKRITDTIQMINQGDIFNLIFRMRGGLARDQFGILHEALFTKAMAGTKDIIEDYHETVMKALDFICDSPIADDEIPTDVKLAFFNETRHAYGRTALMLSGGAYLGFYHVGVARALWKQGLLPRVISGASAGSITASLLGTRNNEELDNFFLRGHIPFRFDFLRPDTKIQSKIGRRLQKWTPQGFRFIVNPVLSLLFDKKLVNIDRAHFKEVIKNNLGFLTFQEAFDRTGRIINITVAPTNNYDPPRLLNYLTAPHICVWSAVVASCSIPGVFDSTPLYVKETNGDFRPEHEWSRAVYIDPKDDFSQAAHVYSDGSFDADLPMQQLSELFNVNHFIISQVNIHSGLLTSLFLPNPYWNTSTVFGMIVSYVRFLKAHVRDWFKNIISMMVHRPDSPHWSTRRGLVQTLLQDYEGRDKDITIQPWKGHINFLQAALVLLKSPSDSEFDELVNAGESRTWPFIPRIKAHCSVEQTLDKCVQRLRSTLAEQSIGKRLLAQQQYQQQQQQDNQLRYSQDDMNNTRSSNDKYASNSMNRVPSFYTTRSILNLSGLSVADPIPECYVAAINDSIDIHNSFDKLTMDQQQLQSQQLQQQQMPGGLQNVSSYSYFPTIRSSSILRSVGGGGISPPTTSTTLHRSQSQQPIVNSTNTLYSSRGNQKAYATSQKEQPSQQSQSQQSSPTNRHRPPLNKTSYNSALTFSNGNITELDNGHYNTNNNDTYTSYDTTNGAAALNNNYNNNYNTTTSSVKSVNDNDEDYYSQQLSPRSPRSRSGSIISSGGGGGNSNSNTSNNTNTMRESTGANAAISTLANLTTINELTSNNNTASNTATNDNSNNSSKDSFSDDLGLSASVPAPDVQLIDHDQPQQSLLSSSSSQQQQLPLLSSQQQRQPLMSSRYTAGSGLSGMSLKPPALTPIHASQSYTAGSSAGGMSMLSPSSGRPRYYNANSLSNSLNNTSSGSGGGADDYENTVPLSSRDLGNSSASSNSSSSSSSSNGFGNNSNNNSNRRGELSRSRYEALAPSRLNESQSGGIVKTTQMSNFYYKRRSSEDALSQLSLPSLASSSADSSNKQQPSPPSSTPQQSSSSGSNSNNTNNTAAMTPPSQPPLIQQQPSSFKSSLRKNQSR